MKFWLVSAAIILLTCFTAYAAWSVAPFLTPKGAYRGAR